MMDILMMRSAVGALKTLARATGMIREATALRRRVRVEKLGGEDRLVHVIMGIEGSQGPKVAVLLKSEVDALLDSQPLKDGFAHASAMAAVERFRAATGAA